MKSYKLFIDESGSESPSDDWSNFYVLSGCIIDEDKRNQLKNDADHIKFKYWGRTEIVFHSEEMGKDINDFEIFKNNPKLKSEFEKDLFNFLFRSPIKIMTVIIDKKLARKRGWNKNKVIKESCRCLIYHFIAFLLCKKKAKGKIIAESATTEKNLYFLKTFSYFLSPGYSELDRNHEEIKNILTSISFVTKRNHDIEEQLADLFAYGATCKYRRDLKIKNIIKDSYEDKIISVLEKKLLQECSKSTEKKLGLLKNTEYFCILPTK
jgi:hypothetical protein